ncbi:MAG TPA: DoxX family protein [Chthoniobacterales bacterium]|jgi:uncharacterized membrane protein YphA (DoxX/SURF4 family)|nr:DoxX family protein [Chthoniobacterales bacterium]
MLCDLGLLVLRIAAFLLAFTFGIQKIGWYIAAFHSNAPFASVGLAPLIAKMGFPASVILALWITFNESMGAFLIGCGLFTRVLSISLTLGMIGALYTSVQLGEDWLRAALYSIVFAALSLTGAGQFSIGRWIQIRKAKSVREKNCSAWQ